MEHQQTVKFIDGERHGRFVLEEDGREIGELTFSRARDNLVIADHTGVDESARGTGGGQRLFNALVKWARENDTKVMALCPYVKRQFELSPLAADVKA
jgi:predicted GNAT family acetyltransferase